MKIKKNNFFRYIMISVAIFLTVVSVAGIYEYILEGSTYVESKGFRIKGESALAIYSGILIFSTYVFYLFFKEK